MSNNDFVSMNAQVFNLYRDHEKDWRDFFQYKQKVYRERAKIQHEQNLVNNRIFKQVDNL